MGRALAGRGCPLSGLTVKPDTKQRPLPQIFSRPADYDPVREASRVSLLGLADLAPGEPMRCVLHHDDGTEEKIELGYSFGEAQVGWFRAGSALNLQAGAAPVGEDSLLERCAQACPLAVPTRLRRGHRTPAGLKSWSPEVGWLPEPARASTRAGVRFRAAFALEPPMGWPSAGGETANVRTGRGALAASNERNCFGGTGVPLAGP